VARTPSNDAEFARFAQTLNVTKTPLTIVGVGDVLSFGPVSVDVLAPVMNGDSSGNDDSLVLRVKFGERAILLTGDIEKRAEASLVTSGRALDTDVIKVPHHGSRTSSTEPFVNATRPRIAIISVGLTSMFGHPHKEVVDRWKANGAQVLTTGKCGTISVSTDGKDLKLKTYVEC
jgi:competence protein ComEC